MMKRLFALVAALLAAVWMPTPLSAQQAGSDSNVEARAGDLRIIHFWSTKPEEVRAALAQPDPQPIDMVNAAERNQLVQQFILYGNCRRDPDGHCWLSATVDITAPDGTPYEDTLHFDALPLGPAVPRDTIGVAPGSMALVIEDGEQLGRYRIRLAVTDEIAVETAVSTIHLDIVEAGTSPTQ